MVRPSSLCSDLVFIGYSAFISLVIASMVLPSSLWLVSPVSGQSFGSLDSAPTFTCCGLDYSFGLVNDQSIDSLNREPPFKGLSRLLFLRQFNGPSVQFMFRPYVHWIFSLYFAGYCVDGSSFQSMVRQPSKWSVLRFIGFSTDIYLLWRRLYSFGPVND